MVLIMTNLIRMKKMKTRKLLALFTGCPSWSGASAKERNYFFLNLTKEELTLWPDKVIMCHPNGNFCNCCGSYWEFTLNTCGNHPGIKLYLDDDGKGDKKVGNEERAVIQTKNGPITISVLTSWK
jgi:hypothetical protein